MADTFTPYTGDGSTDSFSVPFPYLDESYVHLYVDGVEDTGAVFINASTIQASSPPVDQAFVLVKRETPRGNLVVNIPTSGTLRGEDIDLQSQQVLHIAAEAFDALDGTIALDPLDGQWDAESKKIKGLVDPTEAQQAATKNYVDTAPDSAAAAALASASAASDSAAAALGSEGNASTSAGSASGSASSASTSEGNALTYSNSAFSDRSLAETARTGAEAAQTATEASYDSFDDRYLGVKSSDPTLDNDGDALATGALYFHSSTGMKVYDGATWLGQFQGGAAYALLAGGSFTGPVIFESTMQVGLDGGGDAFLEFFDDTNDTTRSFGWDDVTSTFSAEDSSGVLKKLLLEGDAGGGGIQSIQTFTASDTWNKPAGINKVLVFATGGGGGGGAVYGVGGDAAGTAIKFIDVSAISSVTITVGAGGAGGLEGGDRDGANGGNSSFGAHCTGNGGVGGQGSSSNNYDAGTGGTATGGDLNISGGGGGWNTGNNAYGGSSFWGGAAGDTYQGAAHDSTCPGAGGPGSNDTTGGADDGGDGADGIIWVIELA